MGYFSNAIHGISWMAGLRFFTRGITFFRLAILARILSPAQFGTFGIATLILAFLEILTETGINVFLIQSEKKVEEYMHTAWVVSILRGILLSLFLFLSAPFIASFFNDASSEMIIKFLSIVPLMRGFINPAVVNFQKNLRFKQEFWYRSTVFLFDSLVTIVIALITRDVIAFVYGLIAGVILEVILSFVVVSPRPKFAYEATKLRMIIGRGKWVTIYGVFHYLAQEGDNAVVGKMLGTGPLGIYQNAYKLSTLPISEITDVVSKVVFPIYTKIAGDRHRLWKAFIRSTLFIVLGASVISFILILFPKEIVLLLLGDKWRGAIPVIQILSLYGLLRAIVGSVSSLFLAVNKQEYVAAMTFTRFFGLAVTVIPLTQMYGIIGASSAAVISVLLEIPVILYCTYKVFRKEQ